MFVTYYDIPTALGSCKIVIYSKTIFTGILVASIDVSPQYINGNKPMPSTGLELVVP